METLATRARSAAPRNASICSRISFGMPLMDNLVLWHSLSSGWMRLASESRGVICPAFMGALVVLLGFPFGGFRGVVAVCGKGGNERFVKRKDNNPLLL
ncbi:hypothetical protein B9Z19DRAFT_1101171 [Tuber borchii]|uniref:Uncharacterized protein n=1 Tax=Tuber borchii TaxID=42251 RepID=A0A2T6ZTS1_TUBBO|nr:hypothetical protein B9Z19DRAFT_1101171 [Tuber borchii]